MVSHENNYEITRRQLDQTPDVLRHSRWPLDHPDESYYFVQLRIGSMASGYQNSVLAAPPSEDGLEYWIAFGNQLATSLNIPLSVIERQAGYYEEIQSELGEEGVDIASAFQAAQELAPGETWEYFMAKVSNYSEYLQAPASTETKDPDHYIDLAESLLVAARYNPDLAAEATTEVEQQLMSISSLFLQANKVGLALSFGRSITEPQRADQFITAMAEKLRELRTVEGDESYRRVYNHAMAILPDYSRSLFLQQLPKEHTPRIPGSDYELIPGAEGDILNERFEKRSLVNAALSNGDVVAMPNITYGERTIMGYDTVREVEIYGSQAGVEYDKLPDDAKAAIEIGITVANEERIRTETLPYYKRLALWPKEEGDALYTVAPKDRIPRPMWRYPDHHMLVTSDSERQLDFPVEAIELTTSTYMALPYDGGYIWGQKLDDCEPNFFGPGEDVANAFWVTGSPRVVHSKTDARLTMSGEHGTSARFVIVPVCYYNIKEDKEEA